MSQKNRLCRRILILTAISIDIGINVVMYGTFCSQSELAITAYLWLRGADGPRVSIRNIDGRKDIYIYCGQLNHSRNVFAGIQNIVAIEGGYNEIDINSLMCSTRLESIRIGFSQFINHENMVCFNKLENADGCIDMPFKNPILKQRCRRWGIAIRATESNLDVICSAEESKDYDLIIEDYFLRRLTKYQRHQLYRSKYPYINNWRRDCFFEEHPELNDWINLGMIICR